MKKIKGLMTAFANHEINQRVIILGLAYILFSCNKDYKLVYPKPQVSIADIALINESTIACYTVSCVGDTTGSKIKDFGICYSYTNAEPTLDDSLISLINKGLYIPYQQLNHLTRDVKFYIRAYATNQGGTEYSSIKTVFTNTNIATLGGDCWELKNLQVDHYSDGTIIPEVNDASWKTLTTGAWKYNGGGLYKSKLYNWYAVMGIHDSASFTNPSLRKNLAPSNYHIATQQEWEALRTSIKDSVTFISQFRVMYEGQIKETGTPSQIGYQANWWCKGEANLYNEATYYFTQNKGLIKDSINTKLGFSVRCIRDN